MYFVGFALSALLGWNLVISGYVWIGLFFLSGLPVFVAAWISEWSRRGDIDAKLARAFAEIDKPDDQFEVRRSTESAADFVDRMLAYCPALDHEVTRAVAELLPPKVGQSMTDWVERWPVESLQDEPPANSQIEHFRADDTIGSWAKRLGAQLAHLSGDDPLDLTAKILGQAKYCRPRIDESLEAYQERFQGWFANLDRGLDLSSIQSGIVDGEPTRAWLDRTAPLYLTVEEGECIEDVIKKLEAIASDFPPHVGEPALVWLNRVKPAIDSANSD